jgi:hypothetical protein
VTSRRLALSWFRVFAAVIDRSPARPLFPTKAIARLGLRLAEGRPIRLENHARWHSARATRLRRVLGRDDEVARVHDVIRALYLLASESEPGEARARAAKKTCRARCDHDGRMSAGPGERPDCAREGECLRRLIGEKKRVAEAHCPSGCTRRLPLAKEIPVRASGALALFFERKNKRKTERSVA